MTKDSVGGTALPFCVFVVDGMESYDYSGRTINGAWGPGEPDDAATACTWVATRNMGRPSVFMNEFADPYRWQRHAPWARQTHNDFVVVGTENGNSLFKSLFVAGYYFANDIDKDASIGVGGVHRYGCPPGRHNERKS